MAATLGSTTALKATVGARQAPHTGSPAFLTGLCSTENEDQNAAENHLPKQILIDSTNILCMTEWLLAGYLLALISLHLSVHILDLLGSRWHFFAVCYARKLIFGFL